MQRGFREPKDKPRRFYKAVDVSQADGGFIVLLDGRNLRTPQGAKLVLPTRPLADQVAEEWIAQGEVLEMAGMHATRLANTAVESVAQAREATAKEVADFAASDLICYFAEAPQALVHRQTQAWGPILDRAHAEARLAFLRAAGVVHRPQPQETLDRVKAIALEQDDFALTGLAFGAALFGSAILAIALQRGWISGEQAFELSRIDEAWQEEQWGVDDEAAQRTSRLRAEAAMLERWFRGSAES